MYLSFEMSFVFLWLYVFLIQQYKDSIYFLEKEKKGLESFAEKKLLIIKGLDFFKSLANFLLFKIKESSSFDLLGLLFFVVLCLNKMKISHWS